MDKRLTDRQVLGGLGGGFPTLAEVSAAGRPVIEERPRGPGSLLVPSPIIKQASWRGNSQLKLAVFND